LPLIYKLPDEQSRSGKRNEKFRSSLSQPDVTGFVFVTSSARWKDSQSQRSTDYITHRAISKALPTSSSSDPGSALPLCDDLLLIGPNGCGKRTIIEALSADAKAALIKNTRRGRVHKTKENLSTNLLKGLLRFQGRWLRY
jgi:hypothetical protein